MEYYAYRHLDVDRPDWRPLEQVASRTAKRRDVPTIDPGDFMYMGHLRSVDGEPDLHLYKHYKSRRYLNIDEQLRFFTFLCGEEDKPFFEATVYYRRLRSTREAIERLEPDRFSSPASTLAGDLRDNVVPLRRRRRGGSVA